MVWFGGWLTRLREMIAAWYEGFVPGAPPGATPLGGALWMDAPVMLVTPTHKGGTKKDPAS